ncbi:cache domain-containing protein [Methanogenium organophilum]|uniref:Cache domain-containing protein n=1 Tax=Methanogenium organophilum TaxID=2199 RepID=A0A9X9T7X9_METOG|nr:cache domain-containing protein [Methanogenium organophilum]WAI01569.1 cache domain-containing protein [Methanogenium organophilum]
MVNRFSVLVIVGVCLCLFSAGCTTSPDATVTPGDNEMTVLLDCAIANVSSGLSQLQESNAENAKELSQTGITGVAANTLLQEKLTGTSPYVISSLAIDPEGIVTAAAPAHYEIIAGMDLGYQSEVQYANEVKEPVLSGIFMLEEGFPGISLSYPIFSDTGAYLGYTDLTFRPEIFLRQYFRPITKETGYEFMVLQTDGTILYETNEEEVGKNTFTDPLYQSTEIQILAEKVVAESSGRGVYTFWDTDWKKEVSRELYWSTVTFDGTEWRVAIIRDINTSLSPTPLPTPRSDTVLDEDILRVESFVEDAAAFAQQNGRDVALAAFNDPEGDFIDGELYIFAYDMNGTTLAHPYQPGIIGENRTAVVDGNGLEIIKCCRDLAARGGGYLYFTFPNPSDSYRDELKLAAIRPVDDTWYVGSGIYIPEMNVALNQTAIDTLIGRVKEAQAFALTTSSYGDNTEIFVAMNEKFGDDANYVFAYDMNGTCLNLPFQPEMTGTDRLNFTDAYGVRAVELEIDAAKRGGGYVYVVYENPDTGMEELKFCYVAPVMDMYFVGSGVYAGAVG